MNRETTVRNNFQTLFWIGFATLLALFGNADSAFSQTKRAYEDDGCGSIKWRTERPPYGGGEIAGTFDLQIKEQRLTAPAKKLAIDAGKNGGVRIVGWERPEIHIKACVQAFGRDQSEARARTAAVQIETTGGILRAVSTANGGDEYGFGVSYDIRVPINTDLTIKANNGGINLASIHGTIEFDLNNGGAILDKIVGSVRGRTVNGGLTVKLSGERWEGEGVDISTTNGGVLIEVPDGYAARLETISSRNSFRIDQSFARPREDKSKFDLNSGAGGAIVKAVTVNGQVTIRRRVETGKENKL